MFEIQSLEMLDYYKTITPSSLPLLSVGCSETVLDR